MHRILNPYGEFKDYKMAATESSLEFTHGYKVVAPNALGIPDPSTNKDRYIYCLSIDGRDRNIARQVKGLSYNFSIFTAGSCETKSLKSI